MYDLLMYTTRLRIKADRGSSKEWKVSIVLWWLIFNIESSLWATTKEDSVNWYI